MNEMKCWKYSSWGGIQKNVFFLITYELDH